MRKDELITEIQAVLKEANPGSPDYSKTRIEQVLDALRSVAKSELKSEKSFEIYGFFKLSVRNYAARNGRNPVTGEQMQVAARQKVKATASKKFSDEVCL